MPLAHGAVDSARDLLGKAQDSVALSLFVEREDVDDDLLPLSLHRERFLRLPCPNKNLSSAIGQYWPAMAADRPHAACGAGARCCTDTPAACAQVYLGLGTCLDACEVM